MLNKVRGEARIRVEFDEPHKAGTFKPRDKVSGKVFIEAITDIKCKGVDIELGWHTEGKGDRNAELVEVDQILTEGLSAHETIEHAFSFKLPDMPWSYHGELIQIVWAIDVRIDIANRLDIMGMMDIHHSQSIVVDPAS